MNTLRKKKNQEPDEERAYKPGFLARFFIRILDGSFLSPKRTSRQFLFIGIVVLLSVLYIANSYRAEKTVRRTYRIAEELKELRSEYVSLKSELMYRSNQSEVSKIAAPLGLKESTEPPFKLFVNNEKNTEEN